MWVLISWSYRYPTRRHLFYPWPVLLFLVLESSFMFKCTYQTTRGREDYSTKTSHKMSPMYKVPVVHSFKHPLILPHPRLFPLYWRFVYWYIFRCFRFCFHAEFTISASFYNVKNCVVFWRCVVFVHVYSSLL